VKGVIYKVTNKTNGKVYIGQTSNFKKRKSDHLYCANANLFNYPFYNAIRKYGKENFEWRMLCECFTQEDLNIVENSFIEYYGGVNSDRNYNMKEGGYRGKLSSESIEKIRLSKIGDKNPMFGKPHSQKHKEKISKSLAGIIRKPLSLEHRKKISRNSAVCVDIALGDIINEIKQDNKITAVRLGRKFHVINDTITYKIKKFGFKGFKDFKQCILNIR